MNIVYTKKEVQKYIELSDASGHAKKGEVAVCYKSDTIGQLTRWWVYGCSKEKFTNLLTSTKNRKKYIRHFGTDVFDLFFHVPLEELPRYINDYRVGHIVKWRFLIGK